MTGGRWSGRRAQGGTAQPGEGRRTTSMTALRGKRALLDFPAPTTTRPALIARTACPCAANLPRADAVATQFRSMSRLLGFAGTASRHRRRPRRPSGFTHERWKQRTRGTVGGASALLIRDVWLYLSRSFWTCLRSFGETRFAPRTWTDPGRGSWDDGDDCIAAGSPCARVRPAAVLTV